MPYISLGFPGGSEGKGSVCNAGDTGSISDPDPGRFPYAEKQPSLCATTIPLCSRAQEPQLLSPGAVTSWYAPEAMLPPQE